MKFINYLTSIAGVDIFPLISLLVFFAFFTGLIVYVVRTDKEVIQSMEVLPLEQESNNNKQ